MERIDWRYDLTTMSGGTGQSTVLGGVAEYFDLARVCSVVTKFDDGGDSGVLAEHYGVEKPGDFRRCVVSVADPSVNPEFRLLSETRFKEVNGPPLYRKRIEDLILAAIYATVDSDDKAGIALNRVFEFAQNHSQFQDLLNFKFPREQKTGDLPLPLQGRCMGNLMIAASQLINGGDFDKGSKMYKEMFGVRGEVEFVTKTDSNLGLSHPDNHVTIGESKIGKVDINSPDFRLFLTNPGARINPKVEGDILPHSKVIVLGPGSRMTSIKATLIVPGVLEALRQARSNGAEIVYIPPLFTDSESSWQTSVSENIRSLDDAIDLSLLTCVLVNSLTIPAQTIKRYVDYQQGHIEVDLAECEKLLPDARIMPSPLFMLDDFDRGRHNRHVLGNELYKLAQVS